MTLEVLVANNTPYLSVAAYKARAGIEGSDQDEMLMDLLEASQALIDFYVGRNLNVETVRESWALEMPRHSVTLSKWPVTGTPLIYKYNNALQSNFLPEIDVRSGILRGVGQWSNSFFGMGIWSIEYQGGYTVIPASVKLAMASLVKFIQTQDRRRLGVRSERIEGVQAVTYLDEDKMGAFPLPPLVKTLLQPFRDR